MKKKLVEWGPSVVPINFVGRSFTSPPNSKAIEETKDKISIQEMNGESCPNKSVCMTGTLDSIRRHLFTDSIIGVPLSDNWKVFNRDRYDGTTDPNEHLDAYITHMLLKMESFDVSNPLGPEAMLCFRFRFYYGV